MSTVDPNQETADLVVVGAGAAGLATAIFAKEAGPDLHIVLLEGAKKVGAKILISGGGRCNVTHRVVHESDFQGNQPIVRGLLRSFTETDTVEWFASMGVELKEEDTGKLFPTTDSARTVLDALLKRCADLGIELLTSHRVQAVRPSETGWTIEHTEGSHTPRRVAIATGGLALPKSGSDGFGLDLARDLGHEVTPTWPGLVPLLLEDSFPHARLSGIAHEVELTTWIEGKLADRRAGALLWTHFGISGPVAMDASRFLVGAHHKGKQAHITASLLPDHTPESLRELLNQTSRDEPKRTIGSLLARSLPKRVVEIVLELSEIDGNPPIAQLPKQTKKSLVTTLTALELPITGDRGWSYAEVTAGGVPLAEIDRRTMESRRHRGLHFVGEVLDCEGRIGGFNFQWAWTTGHQAGEAIASKLKS